MSDTDHCAYCGAPFTADEYGNTDKYHRQTPLCPTCFADPVRVRLTASAYDPTSWWNLSPPMNPAFAPGTKLRQPN
jgi:hypothetical protein